MTKGKLFLCLSALLLITFSCKKEYVPVVSTSAITTITSASAISGGLILDEGGSGVISAGICWSSEPNPKTTDNRTAERLNEGSFVSEIKDLTASTTYYLRAYAVNSTGTGYGNEISFTTSDPTLPEITTKAIILPFFDGMYYQLISGGDIYTDGGMPITTRGVCWSTTNQVPSLLDNKTIDGSGKGSFLSKISTRRGTTYYARAYAINSLDTVYGNTVNFTTPCYLGFMPNVYSLSLTSPSNGSVGNSLETKLIWSCHSEGTMSFDVYLDTVPDPVRKYATNITASSIILSGLDSATVYYWKIYAFNPLLSCETFTSQIRSFTTVGRPIILTSQVTEYTQTYAIVGGNITNDGGKTVTENGVYWGVSPNPVVTGTKLPLGSGIGQFSGNLSGLTSNTKYYVQALQLTITD